MPRTPLSISIPLALAGALAVLPAACAFDTPALDTLQTRAERTDFLETTRYDEVVDFIGVVDAASRRIHATTYGYTFEGRPMPLAVFGDVADASAESVLASGRTRVFVQANIHGGEVEGKEASLMLLRSIAAGEHGAWADSLVVLFAPIYNADGNERFSVMNRSAQYGPFGGVGTRANAQGYDLNRDHMKLDSPEAHALVGLLNRYDPHVVVDLHTTNGTTHAYHLTYSAPMHPATDPAIIRLLREEWLPTVTRAIKEQYGWDFYYYGNVSNRGEPGWYTFDYRARFNNNYVGLRNRFAILSEAYSYAPFQERVDATLRFVEEILDFAHANAGRIREITAAADAASVVGRELAVRAEFQRSAEPVDILMGAVETVLSPYSGRRARARADVSRPTPMYEYGTFSPAETTHVPAAYLIPPELTAVLDKLEAHGIAAEPLGREATLRVERFRIDSTELSPREYEGHNEREITGAWVPAELTLPADTRVVSLDGPLGRLAFSLLEPRAADALLHWNVLDRVIEGARFYPVLRSHEPVR